MKILAVDDEPFILELIPLLAARSGFKDVTTVSSGARALDVLVAGDPFDCLLLDINMPGMNGIDLCRQVRQLPAYRKTPIIMLTAMSDREYMDSAFKAGATDYATKPFDINELGARLRVANDLVTAWREAGSANGAPPETGEQSALSGLSAPLHLEGVRDLVDFESFKNYLKQSSRAGLASSQVVAIKVDRIADIHARASAAEFTYALRQVADCINDVLRRWGGLLSHAGNGVFVAVSNGAAPLSAREFEAEVQYLLDDRSAEFDSGQPMDLEVSIGSPLQPSASDAADASRLIERATARAECRAEAKHSGPVVVNIRRIGQ